MTLKKHSSTFTKVAVNNKQASPVDLFTNRRHYKGRKRQKAPKNDRNCRFRQLVWPLCRFHFQLLNFCASYVVCWRFFPKIFPKSSKWTSWPRSRTQPQMGPKGSDLAFLWLRFCVSVFCNSKISDEKLRHLDRFPKQSPFHLDRNQISRSPYLTSYQYIRR